VEEGSFAGVVTLVARQGEVAHCECVGVMDKETGRPMQPDTLFRIYSMTKPVTSVALLMLYEEGRVRLSDPVSRFIPEFRDLKVFRRSLPIGMELAGLQREITIRDLLTHTAGLGYGGLEDSPVEAMYRNPELLPWQGCSLEEFVAALVKLPLVQQPGTRWRYSAATDVVGRLVEIISGMTLDRFFAEHIFQPLGMVDTGFVVPPEKLSRFATVYMHQPDGSLKAADTPEKSAFVGSVPFLSTIADYFRFSQMLLNNGALDGMRLLSRKTVELMTTNHLPPSMLPFGDKDDGYGFGLGVSVLMDMSRYGSLGSAGTYEWGGAANTAFWIDPKEKLIGILMTQFMPAWHFPLSDDFRMAAYQAIAD
jgi:CubicO group peptidase (beta-lactamase class C family)